MSGNLKARFEVLLAQETPSFSEYRYSEDDDTKQRSRLNTEVDILQMTTVLSVR